MDDPTSHHFAATHPSALGGGAGLKFPANTSFTNGSLTACEPRCRVSDAAHVAESRSALRASRSGTCKCSGHARCERIACEKAHASYRYVPARAGDFARPRRLLRAALFCFTLLAFSSAHGRVFLRWGAAAQSDRAIESIGGNVAYRAPVKINGADARLVLFSLKKPITQVFRELRRTFKLSAQDFRGGTLGFATSEADGLILRLIVLRLTAEDQTLIFKLEQTQHEFDASQRAPYDIDIEGVPSYPDMRPQFTASDEQTHAQVAVATSAATPDEIYTFYDSELRASGWFTALPERMPVQNAGLGVYIKERKVCCVLAESTPDSGGTRITILHKERGTIE